MKLVLCWDLDETLGFFRPVADELLRTAEARGDLGLRRRAPHVLRELLARVGAASRAPPTGELRLREGIADVLAAFRERGFVQVVTTAAFREYAVSALERTGLR